MQSESSKSIERWQLSYVQMNICHLKTLKEKTPTITKGNHEIDKLLIKAKHLVLPLKSANYETTLTSSGMSWNTGFLFISLFFFQQVGILTTPPAKCKPLQPHVPCESRTEVHMCSQTWNCLVSSSIENQPRFRVPNTQITSKYLTTMGL
jgi:hypothetical protein